MSELSCKKIVMGYLYMCLDLIELIWLNQSQFEVYQVTEDPLIKSLLEVGNRKIPSKPNKFDYI